MSTLRAGARWGLLACLLALSSAGRGAVAAAAQEEEAPVPVLLVPGWFDTAEALAGLRVRLRAAGWPTERLAAVTFEDPVGGNRAHAREVARAVELLRRRTGAPRVDIIAHSMGGLATRLYLLEHPGTVRRVVFLATPHRGTLAAYLAFGEAREEMLPGSALLDSLNAAAPAPDGVEALTIRTVLDTHVIPAESATLPGVPDSVVCCASHEGLIRDLEAFRAVRQFLLGRGDRSEGEVGGGALSPPKWRSRAARPASGPSR